MAEKSSLPIIDLGAYLDQGSPEAVERVVGQVKEACQQYGFFLVKGHGVPLKSQQYLLQALERFFSLPTEEKLKLSFLKNPCRRGYEASGMSLRAGDALPDSKEVRGPVSTILLHSFHYGVSF